MDGASAPIVRADYAFRGVRLGPGEHHVEFHYAPGSLRAAAAVSTVALVIVLILLAARRR